MSIGRELRVDDIAGRRAKPLRCLEVVLRIGRHVHTKFLDNRKEIVVVGLLVVIAATAEIAFACRSRFPALRLTCEKIVV